MYVLSCCVIWNKIIWTKEYSFKNFNFYFLPVLQDFLSINLHNFSYRIGCVEDFLRIYFLSDAFQRVEFAIPSHFLLKCYNLFICLVHYKWKSIYRMNARIKVSSKVQIVSFIQVNSNYSLKVKFKDTKPNVRTYTEYKKLKKLWTIWHRVGLLIIH